jgi:hypothetical protein
LIYAQGQESGFGGGSQGYNSVVGEMMMKFYSEWVKSSSEITLSVGITSSLSITTRLAHRL